MRTAEVAPRATLHAVREGKRVSVGTEGQILGGKYRLERRIATGGSASVWRAMHETLNRPVAVKFVDARSTAGDEERVGRFLREAKVAASVRHKNVVDILDFGVCEHDGVAEPYMIMELLEGEALDEMLGRGLLPVQSAASVVRQILSGLEAVHAAGIIHRDLKPGNVFVTEDGDGLFARLLDFGISQNSDDTSDRTVVGTPEYMSPEQAFGDPLDARSDIYSVGVILYEMLAGYPPFEDEDPSRVLRLVVETRPPSLAAARPDEPALCQVAEKAMSREPAQRYSSARTMQRALVDAMGGPDTTGRHSVPDPASRPSGKYRREAPTLDAVVTPRPTPPTRPSGGLVAPRRPRPASRRGRTIGLTLAAMAIVAAVVGLWLARHGASAAPGPGTSSASPSPPAHTSAATTPAAAPPSSAAAPASSARVPDPSSVAAQEPADPSAPPRPEPPRSARSRRAASGSAPAPAPAPGGITRELDF